VRRLEGHRRRPHFGDAFLRVHRHALGALDRLLGRPRQFRLAADDATVFTATATCPCTSAATTDRHAGVVKLVFVVERLQREPAMRLLATASSLGDVRVVLAHCLRLVDLQLSIKSL